MCVTPFSKFAATPAFGHWTVDLDMVQLLPVVDATLVCSVFAPQLVIMLGCLGQLLEKPPRSRAQIALKSRDIAQALVNDNSA